MKAKHTFNLGVLFSLLALIFMVSCESTPPQKKAEQPKEKKDPKKDVKVVDAGKKKDEVKKVPLRDDEKRLNEYTKGKSAEEAQQQSFIDHLVKSAKAKVSRHEYNAAKVQLDEALRLDPTHTEANRLRDEVGSLLGESTSRNRRIIDEKEREINVIKEQAKLEARNHYKAGLEELKHKDYDNAIRSFESCLEIIKWAPYELNLEALRRQTENKIKEAKQQKERGQEEIRVKKMKEAQKEAERLESEEQSRRLTEIKILLTRATEFYTKKDFAKAETLVGQVLQLDPVNKVAKQLQKDIDEARHSNIAATTLERKIEAWKDFIDEMKETSVPYTSNIMYPNKQDWHNMVDRRKKSKSLKTDNSDKKSTSKVEQDIITKLESQNIDLSFTETPFNDVIRYIQATSSINIVVDPKVLQQFQIEGTKVTLNVKDLKLKTALNILLQFYNLVYLFRNEVLFITNKESELAKGVSVPELHDIRDLTGQIKDFPGPKIRLLEATGNNQASAGAVFEEQTEGGGAVLTGEKLTELIKASIAPESWDKGENSIAETSGQLLVINTEEIQNEVRKFLSDMRRFSGMMVAIETRFLEVTDDFLENLGVDWRGIGDNNLRNNTGSPNVEGVTDDDLRAVMPAVTREGDDDASVSGQSPDNTGQPLSLSPAAGAFFKDDRTDTRARTEQVDEQGFGKRLKNTGGFAFQMAFLEDVELNAVLRAVKKSSRAEVLTAPRLTAFNTQRANITIVDQISYIRDFDVEVAQSAYIADPVIGTIQSGVVLDVRPTISNDRKFITMELRPTVASLVGGVFKEVTISLGGAQRVTFQFPTLQLQSVETTVRIPDQGTIMLGGFKSFRQQDRKQDIPILGDIPIISFFFSQKSKSDEKQHLMIMVKAKIIDLEEEEEKAVGSSR